MSQSIDSFKGDFRFLSSFYRCTLNFEGKRYRSVENAYQAAKTLDQSQRDFISSMSPGDAKRFGSIIQIRPDWEAIKLDTMKSLQAQKFENPFLRPLLLATVGVPLVEGNTWHDNYWGNCVCKNCSLIEGQNILGKILEEIREKILQEEGNL